MGGGGIWLICCVVCCIWISAVVISGTIGIHKCKHLHSVEINRHIHIWSNLCYMLCSHGPLVMTYSHSYRVV